MLIFGILLLPEDVFCNQRLKAHTRGENDKIPYFLDDVENADSAHKSPVYYFQDEVLQDEVLQDEVLQDEAFQNEAPRSETFYFSYSTWHVNKRTP